MCHNCARAFPSDAALFSAQSPDTLLDPVAHSPLYLQCGIASDSGAFHDLLTRADEASTRKSFMRYLDVSVTAQLMPRLPRSSTARAPTLCLISAAASAALLLWYLISGAHWYAPTGTYETLQKNLGQDASAAVPPCTNRSTRHPLRRLAEVQGKRGRSGVLEHSVVMQEALTSFTRIPPSVPSSYHHGSGAEAMRAKLASLQLPGPSVSNSKCRMLATSCFQWHSPQMRPINLWHCCGSTGSWSWVHLESLAWSTLCKS